MEKVLHYEVGRRLGEDDKPDSFLSYDSLRDLPVVIRLLDEKAASDEVFRRQFSESMRRLGHRDHHHMTEFFLLESANDRVFAVREYTEGETLKELVAAEPFAYHLFLNIASQIVKGIQVAHSCGVVHGNISPYNIIISKRGEAKVVDFCLPGDRSQDRTGTGNVGHLEYLSPEQLEGRPTVEASDIFSLGVVFYEMLTGQLPFHGENQVELREAILTAPPDLRSIYAATLPNEARLLIDKMLSRNPVHRGQSADELLVTLEAMAANQPAAVVIEQSHGRRWTPRSYLLISMLAVLLVIFWLVVTTDFSQ